jgi:uncharacterized protein (DUF488 family)
MESDTSGSVTVFTIGHSDHTLEELVDMLRKHGVTTLADVRSQPYSLWAPQFNRESLQRALQQAGVSYVYMGAALGGRPGDQALYLPGDERPDYRRLAATTEFQGGLDDLVELAQLQVVAMMCNEGDPNKCHRALLITPELLARGARVIHILSDSRLEQAQPQPKQLSLF